MDVHLYDPATGEYLGSRPAQPDPREGGFLVPAFATILAPPPARDNIARIWNVDGWEEAPDHRGTRFWHPDGSEGLITAIGAEPPADALSEPPPPSFEEQRTAAIEAAVTLASTYRARVVATRPERAIGWMLKALFGAVAQMDDAATDTNPARQALANIAVQGFAMEGSITGEDPAALLDGSVASASQLFLALQLVEGMERLATQLIPATQDQAALDAVVDQLRALEDGAAEQLAQITGGSNV